MKKIFLIDGNNFIYRMFFAIPEFSTKSGKIVNATFGMAKFFLHSLVKMNPDYIMFIKDAKGENFRHKIYSEYKATRDRMPDDLRTQISDIEKMIELMGIDIIEYSGYEADDVIGTCANKLGKDKEFDVYILSGDKDLYSLITKNVFVYDTMKKQVFNIDKTIEKFGVKPEMIIDYLAIVGDKADNIPGIDGFGPKKAVDLINNIGNIEQIFIEVEKLKNGETTFMDYEKTIMSCFKGKTFEKLKNSKDEAFLSKRLATIELNLDLNDIGKNNFNLEDFKFIKDNLKTDKVMDFLQDLEFYSLTGNQKEIKFKTIKDINLNTIVIKNKSELDNLYNSIIEQKQIIFNIKMVKNNFSIYINFGTNNYYLDNSHIDSNILLEFINNLLNTDIKIIGYNLKQVLKDISKITNISKIKKTDNTFGQISLSL